MSLTVEDIETILNTLIYDGKVEFSLAAGTAEEAGETVKLFRSINPMIIPTGLMRIPCGVCPVSQECHIGGIVSPTNCVYMKEWLEY